MIEDDELGRKLTEAGVRFKVRRGVIVVQPEGTIMAEDYEPEITINEVKLTVAQAMTVRVALGSFALRLQAEDAIGDDKHGRAMRDSYLGVLREILKLIHEG